MKIIIQKGLLILAILSTIIIVLACILIFVPLPDSGKKEGIQVTYPVKNQYVISPLEVSGRAKGNWFFEATFPIKIIDEHGNILGSSFVRAQSDWMTEDFVEFKGELTFSTPIVLKGYIVLAKDNPSGLPQYDKEFRIPVNIRPSGMMKVKAYFNNNNLDPEISCNKVFPVEREMPRVEAIGSAALWETLKGPTNAEKEQGYYTGINFGVKLQGLAIDKDGIATADFDATLGQGVAGSCKVSAIRAQITQTLLQFTTIKNVIISINGRTEDILQP